MSTTAAATTHNGHAKGERTRAALVAAAVDRFAVDGFQRTSLADVARDVGITPAAIYRYFPDKEALFAAAVDADGAALVEVVRETLSGNAPSASLNMFQGVLDRLVEVVDDHPLVARVVSGAEVISPERRASMPNLLAAHDELTQLIRFGQRLTLLRDDIDAAQMALAVETIMLLQLSQIAILRRAGAELDTARSAALAALIEAALAPCPHF